MDDRTGNISETSFTRTRDFFDDINADVISQLVAAGSDIVLVIGPDDIINDTSFSSNEIYANGGRSWFGRSIKEIVTPECDEKIDKLLSDARAGKIGSPREINHRMLEGDDLPVVYKSTRLGDQGEVLMLGQDITRMAALQRRLMSSQLSMEREVSRLRGSESRFRGIFQVSDVPQMVLDAVSLRIVDVNPSASRMFGKTGQKLENKKVLNLFTAKDSAVLHKLLLAAIDGGTMENRTLELADGRVLQMKVSLFRQNRQSYLLVEFFPNSDVVDGQIDPAQQKVLDLIKYMPDGFVMTDENRQILTANEAFFELLHLSGMKDVEGVQLDAFFDRPGVDGNVLLANVREHGMVRRFATVMRSQYAQQMNVEIAARQLDVGGEQVLGFWLRQTNNIIMGSDTEQENISRSNEQISNLVGHMPLKDIVKETTEMIEKLCIDTALELTQNNRASAAQMLGLSRQSLYSKLGKDAS